MANAFPANYRYVFQKKTFGAFRTFMLDGYRQTTAAQVDDLADGTWVHEERVLHKITVDKTRTMD